MKGSLKTSQFICPVTTAGSLKKLDKKNLMKLKTSPMTLSKTMKSQNQKFVSIRPGKKVNDPTVNDIKVIKYSPDGNIQVKLGFDNEFQALPGRKKDKPVPDLTMFSQLRSRSIKIKKQKWDHLQQLKAVLPKDCHLFYDNLPHLGE